MMTNIRPFPQPIRRRRGATLFGAVALALGMMAAATEVAAQTLVTNGSFELGSFSGDGNGAMTLNAGSTTITGWTTYNHQLVWIDITNSFSSAPSDGTKFLDLSGYDDSAPYGGVQQTINTTPGQSYLLAFDIGTNPIYGVPINVTATAGSTSETFSHTSGVSGYTHHQMPFIASGATTLISLLGVDPSGNGIGLDNISVVAIPESAETAGLSGLFVLGLLCFRECRKRKRKENVSAEPQSLSAVSRETR